MERFDLSYQTLDDSDISLVVERLPLNPPDYKSRWEDAKDAQFSKEIAMRFRLGTMPAGIPTWFIARAHRFTTRTHWRTGALFAYGPEQRHLKYTPEEKRVDEMRNHFEYYHDEVQSGQREVRYGINEIQREIKDFRELAQLEFTTAFRREQSKTSRAAQTYSS